MITKSILLFYILILTKVALILEYCSRGDLRTYLIKNRHDFEKSLNGVHLHKIVDTKLLAWNRCIHDVNVLYRWTYQVSHYSNPEFRKPEDFCGAVLSTG